MYKYIIRRFLIFIPMLFVLTIAVYGLIQAAPGDPIAGRLLDPNIDPAAIEKQREALGLNDPVHVQYWNWVKNAAKGDFGESIAYKGRSVSDLINGRIVNTLYLGTFALALTLIVGIPIGIYSARKPYSLLDYGATAFGFFGLAVPSFFFGLVIIYFFSIQLGWFPSQGSVSSPGLTGMELFVDRLHHLVLPGITLGLAGTASYMRYMRSEVLDVLSSDYIRTAKAKGMTDRSVLYKHTLRNAMIPIITLLGFEIGTLLSGAIITEGVFQFPGIGTLFITSIGNRDYPVIMALNLMFGFFILLGNLLADIFYSIVDPRIRYD
ncbi:peptide permease [Bacillus canaveralius]|uniref:Peptide permease n=1 Tax=Bacillus canaveralius TaxID=1403243 RepID=A0A2N5GSU4_9BACI|nr:MULTISPECIES: ABC transporter permease [Bacillus]PLR83576.1 peptide permease [Bacillus sp. V33-4]PLR86835.1 peptide permease [Bacillus canaveralius]PLR92704.1 peptide permease [Bacillus canaveralius]RSK53682.1 ABC transporter permease [Bacillus canaveralius]